jgi:hypothetical protein
MEGALKYGVFQGLKELVVQYAGDENWNGTWAECDMSLMSNAITNALPGLEVLEWSQHLYEKQWHSGSTFGSFSGLKQLISLTVDYQLLVPTGFDSNDKPLHLLAPSEYLPASLQSLHLTDFMDADVQGLSDRYLKTASAATVVNFITNLVTTLPLANIELSLPMGIWHDDYGNGYPELPRRVRKLLSQLVEVLSNMGIVLKVWRQESTQAEITLLYEPGYTAPWPQLQDIPQDQWTESAVLVWKIKTGSREAPSRQTGRDEIGCMKSCIQRMMTEEQMGISRSYSSICEDA